MAVIMNGEDIKRLGKKWGLNESQICAVEGDREFEKSMHQLNLHLSCSGSSLRVDGILEKANNEMRLAKTKYLQRSIVHKKIKRIVLTSRRPEDPRPDSNSFEGVKKLLIATETKTRLNDLLTSTESPQGQGNLLDDDNSESLKVPNREWMNLRQTLTNCLDETVTKLAQLNDFLARDEDLSKPVMETAIIDLPLAVTEMRRRLEEARNRREAAVLTQQALIAKQWRLLSKEGEVLSSIVQLILSYNVDEKNFSYMFVKVKVLMLKVRVLLLEIETKMYKGKVVQVHQKISKHLQKAIETANTEKTVSAQQLSIYESASPEYNSLVTKYLDILRRTEECEWTLAKMMEKK